jgi:hypothetical protein
MADLKQKIQNGLDETRILVLGAQVLIGFQFPSVFQKNFDKLPPLTRELMLVGLGLMLVALGLLIWPTAYHRIVAHGEDTKEFHTFITRAAAPALFPFAAGLGIVLFAGGEKLFGRTPGVWLGAVGAATALWFWYGLEMLARRGHPHARVAKESETMSREPDNQQKISERVKQVLTETRVVLPGAQALLGFQLVIVLTSAFESNSQAPPLDGRVELPKQQVTENRWTTSN